MALFCEGFFLLMDIIIKNKLIKIDKQDLDLFNSYIWHIEKRKSGIEYLGTRILDKIVLFHWILIDKQTGMEIDHINGNGLDNRRENLRICTHKQNMYNKKLYKNNKSGYKGVYMQTGRNKFSVQIRVNGKKIRLGNFKNKEDAAIMYDKSAKLYFGEYARLNFK